MITRTYLRPYTAVRYAWKTLLYCAICAGLAFASAMHPEVPHWEVPVSVVTILGTALAIILGFRNVSAYDRWWEARKIWGGVVNESRTFMRQTLTLANEQRITETQRAELHQLVRTHLGWINALRLQLRQRTAEQEWQQGVARHVAPEVFADLQGFVNKATRLGLIQGRSLKALHSSGFMDSFLYVQIDDTLSRLTDLQGMAERIKSTPLPRPYDYYTMAFLNVFILFFPFGVMETFSSLDLGWSIFPVTMLVGWIFFQIYIFGKVMSNPFANWHTDVALDAICTTIEIDLKQSIGDSDVPVALKPVDGVLM